VKAVHEVEQQCQRYQNTQDNDTDLNSMHGFFYTLNVCRMLN
jgi:hypothetical protein